MNKQINKVLEFQKAFGLTVNEKPVLLSQADRDLRWKLMSEENGEYATTDSLVEILDACADMMYILCGTIVTHGLQDVIEEAFNRVHASNMSKLGKDGKPIINGENGVFDETRPIGKVLKPDHYVPVDLSDLV